MGLLRIDDPRRLDAIEHLYAVFGRYPPRPVDGCPCCVTREDQAALAAAPLRALGEEHLSRYGSKALTTWGETRDFKHFLPRLLELAAAGADWPIDLEHQARKLEYADWRTWPAAEQTAVLAVFSAAFRAAVHGAAPALDWQPAATALDALEELHLDMEPVLDDVFDRLADRPLAHLVRLAQRGLERHRKPLRWRAWLLRDWLRARVECAFFDSTDPVDQERLSYLLTLLEMLPAVSTALAAR